ncbi:hypothetical protein WICPIJ_000578 [Wickerhamomyces pijperi]|uniref:tRNA ligase n=1 Tax=Wickerhamomyces pijperi TaxID=599730 RepID=A0A9P8QGA4_WICPI|nr:hypothetical protein WICPIJ_000578 [Wickerhamomyces pijperi]
MTPKPIKYVLVPISTIGCGKTTVSVCLTGLFPEIFTTVSNDDMSNAKQFFNKSKLALNTFPAVIMDKNNHEKTHRAAIFDTFDPVKDQVDVKFIALNFLGEKNPDEFSKDKRIWDITTKRAIERGDNHQKLKLGKGDGTHIYRIIRMFLNKLEPLDTKEPGSPDLKFDHVIHLNILDNPEDSSLNNVHTIIDQLIQNFPELISVKPEDETILKCYKDALDFKPVVKEKKKKEKVLSGKVTKAKNQKKVK